MKERPRVAIVGPGAIGGTLAAFLYRAGVDVELIGRRTTNLRIDGGPFRARRLPVRSSPSPGRDVFIFCVKSMDTFAAIRRIKSRIKPGAIILSLQNGITHRPILLRAFGRRRCVFGICLIGAERTARDKVRYHGGKGVSIARLGANAKGADSAADLLRRAGLDVSVDSSEDHLLWMKAAFNSATNPLGALTGATNGDLVDVPALKELALTVLKESTSAAKAAGKPLSYKAIADRMIAGLAAMPAQSNSMLQDLRAGRRTELDAIVKPILDAARRHRVATPILSSLYRFTKRLESELV